MASRRRAREFALAALTAAEQAGATAAASLTDLWATLVEEEGWADARAADSEEIEFAQRLAFGVEARRAEIDTQLEAISTHWRVGRMPVVDRNVLRVAAFELMACDEIPPAVTINEAVEIAKRFGGADSGAFVNGLLDRLARQVGRLAGRAEEA